METGILKGVQDMKKNMLSLMLVLAMLLSVLCACGDENAATSSDC